MLSRYSLVCLSILLMLTSPAAASETSVPILVTDLTQDQFILNWHVLDEADIVGFTLHSIDADGNTSAVDLDESTRTFSVSWASNEVLFWLEAHDAEGQSTASNGVWGPLGYPRCPPLTIVQVWTNPPSYFIATGCIDRPPVP